MRHAGGLGRTARAALCDRGAAQASSSVRVSLLGSAATPPLQLLGTPADLRACPALRGRHGRWCSGCCGHAMPRTRQHRLSPRLAAPATAHASARAIRSPCRRSGASMHLRQDAEFGVCTDAGPPMSVRLLLRRCRVPVVVASACAALSRIPQRRENASAAQRAVAHGSMRAPVQAALLHAVVSHDAPPR